MRKYKILSYIVQLSLIGFLLIGCDENMPDFKEIGVESLKLNEGLASGIQLEVNETTNISQMVTLVPENATDRAENYSTSNPEVATVSQNGDVTANEIGTCNITISVGGKSVVFALTVKPKTIIPIKELSLTISTLTIKLGDLFDLAGQVVKDPIESNENLVYNSSNPAVLTVNKDGQLKGISGGWTIITVAAAGNPAINVELEVEVSDRSDYSREGWVMSASHGLPISTANAEGNSWAAALDGKVTYFCLVRPGRFHGDGDNKVTVPAGDAIHFTVDMGVSQKVNYFRIRHRKDNTQLRWYSFDQILGSDDGINFNVIATDVEIPNASSSPQDSPDIIIPTSTYRYLKFYAKEAKCFSSSTTSKTTQIEELYLGVIY